ncbi:EamA family transporter [Streptomyces misionensis]|uniref:EamA family transporter n=1 Tax=Streptomyces misionensis TaxID=67331 RepID=A0A5C6JXH0_9ACTN|nr:DMT family transporter [Streptomyces misionensis]TWV55425.1 EamA family transporter [Streptomyces misionensis]
MKPDKTLLALAATVLLWASAFPAIRVALRGYDYACLSFLRLAVASLVLLAVAPLAQVRRPAWRDLPRIVLVGALGMSAYQLLLNWGELHVPAGTASMIVAVVPAISALLAAVFLGERPTPAKVAGSAVALAGTALIAVAGGETGYPAAAWAVVAAAVVQAAYHLGVKPLLRTYTGLETAAYAMWAGTALLLPLAPRALGAAAHAPAGALAAAVYLGALPSAAGFVVWGYAVARRTVTTATAALYLVPPATLVVAYVWLGERPHPGALLGGLLATAGVALVGRRRPARAAAREEAAPRVGA